jgi:hypothetical protein
MRILEEYGLFMKARGDKATPLIAQHLVKNLILIINVETIFYKLFFFKIDQSVIIQLCSNFLTQLSISTEMSDSGR